MPILKIINQWLVPSRETVLLCYSITFHGEKRSLWWNPSSNSIFRIKWNWSWKRDSPWPADQRGGLSSGSLSSALPLYETKQIPDLPNGNDTQKQPAIARVWKNGLLLVVAVQLEHVCFSVLACRNMGWFDFIVWQSFAACFDLMCRWHFVNSLRPCCVVRCTAS